MNQSLSTGEVPSLPDMGRVFAFRPNPSDQRRLLQVMDVLRHRYGISEPSRLDAVRVALRLAAAQLARAEIKPAS